ncbi:MAG: hypothetical protein ACE5JP_07120 [Candidatus Bipolaricaulia bacterium]
MDWVTIAVGIGGPIIAVIGTLLGNERGARNARKQMELQHQFQQRESVRQQRHRFVEQQVKELYSPMVGIYQEARGKLVVSQRIKAARKKAGATESKESIEYEHRQIEEKLIPGLEKMLDLFREKRWLAEESTEEYYPGLVEFIEIENRFKAGILSSEVRDELDKSSFRALFEDLQNHLRRLRAQLREGMV